jgi:Beta-glucosidase (SUN family)
MQWNPAATSYVYPLSMDGGLYCNSDGSISQPLPNNPYCKKGVGTFIAVNEAAESVAFCQVSIVLVVANSRLFYLETKQC